MKVKFGHVEKAMKINTKSMPDLEGLLKDIPVFKPVAYYDKHLDCIRVKIRDCSVTEERVNRIFTVLKPNNCDVSSPYVGFNIKGIRHLFNQLKIPLTGIVRLVDIIDGIVKQFPEGTILSVIRSVETTDEYQDLEVDFNNHQEAA